MRKIKWLGVPNCSFSRNDVTMDHLLLNCGVAKVVWETLGHV
jgi:hypothetical protein